MRRNRQSGGRTVDSAALPKQIVDFGREFPASLEADVWVAVPGHGTPAVSFLVRFTAKTTVVFGR